MRLRLKLNSLTEYTSPVVNDGRGLGDVQTSLARKSNSELKTGEFWTLAPRDLTLKACKFLQNQLRPSATP